MSAAIAASSVSVKTMADGTLRITCDVEPRDARAAFELFGAPGVPMALAALKTGAASVMAASGKSETGDGGRQPMPGTGFDSPAAPPIGERGRWLAIRCTEPAFREWLSDELGRPVWDEASAAKAVREWCGVESRSHIDGDPLASIKADRLRREFAQHMKRARTA